MEPRPREAGGPAGAGASAGSTGQPGRAERAPTPFHAAHPRQEGAATGGGKQQSAEARRPGRHGGPHRA